MKMTDVGSFIRISVISRDNRLINLDLVCDTKRPGLWEHFSNPTEVEQFITNNTEEAVKMALQKVDDDNFILNCETGKRELIISGRRWEKEQGNKILKFLPVIKMFMTIAMTGYLKDFE